VRHGITTSGLLQQGQVHSPSIFMRNAQQSRFGVRPDTEVEGLRGVERLGGGRHSTPSIELVSHSREPERPIS
jgi:hypothetical protein